MLEFKDFLNEAEAKDVHMSIYKDSMNKTKATAGLWIRNSKSISISVDADSKLALLDKEKQLALADEIAKKVEALVISELEKANK